MVTMCVCYKLSFKELKEVAEKNNCKSIEELKSCITFGINCKLCNPYVEKMLQTGKTSFGIL